MLKKFRLYTKIMKYIACFTTTESNFDKFAMYKFFYIENYIFKHLLSFPNDLVKNIKIKLKLNN